jgi:hypothetical protein
MLSLSSSLSVQGSLADQATLGIGAESRWDSRDLCADGCRNPDWFCVRPIVRIKARPPFVI